MSTNTDLNKKPDQNGHRNGDTKAIGDAKLSQKNPPSQAPTSPSSRSSSDKLDAPQTPRDELRLISKYKSSSRRGSSTFLTSDDNIIMAFGSSRRLSSFCTTSSYEYFNFEFLEFTRFKKLFNSFDWKQRHSTIDRWWTIHRRGNIWNNSSS